MMPHLRTTLTLDEDVVVLLREEMERSRRPFRHVVNQAFRLGLRAATMPESRQPFLVRPHDFRLRPGIDPDKLGQLADEIEVEEFVRRHTHGRRHA